jgi:hypothetical protein
VAFCPHPPLLLPEIAQGATGELDDLRAACRAAIKRVAETSAQLVLVGAGARWQPHRPSAHGSLAPYGVPLEIALGSEQPGPVELPLSLTVGAWLLRDALGADCGAVGWSIGPGPGRLEFDRTDPVALVVMGDGSARRSTSAPGYLDERAAPFDAGVAAALAAGDPAGLAVDADEGAQLLAAGAPVWAAVAPLLQSVTWDGELLYDESPYGVAYFVAAWTRRA